MLFSFLRRQSAKRSSKPAKSSPKPKLAVLSYESLEAREMMATFAVANLNDSGTGSLRQAIIDANSNAGADVISFSVAGSIQLQKALPKITGEVNIDGTTAPGYASAPVVEVDFNGKKGLQFEASASSSELQALAIVDASGAGVTLKGVTGMEIVGNYIGISLGGSAAGNRGDGIDLVSSFTNTIGGSTAAERNVISANGKNGIRLKGSSTNSILGNYIGTNATGTSDFGNVHNGVLLLNGSSSNLIGVGFGNVIAGNNQDGVHIKSNSNSNTLASNYIGTNAAGTAALGNSGDGVEVKSSSGNLIGNEDAVSSIDYFDADDGTALTLPVSGWQGIRAADAANQFLITGTSGTSGLLYEGTIDGNTGTSYLVNYPGSTGSSVYGPDNLGSGNIRLVGTYQDGSPTVSVHSFIYEGTTSDLGNAGNYQTIDFPGADYNYAHSTAGGLVVGNYDSPTAHGTHSLPLGPGHAFIYDIDTDAFLEDVVYPGSISNTAYGIWFNGGTSYTIVGGYSTSPVENFSDQEVPLGLAYMVDYDTATEQFTNWKSFEYPHGVNFDTHFQGISSVEKGVYTLSANSVQSGSSGPSQGSWVTVRRNTDGSFSDAVWVDLDYTGSSGSDLTSSDSVYGNTVVGFVSGSAFSYQATVNTAFQLSNVISGNGGNGVNLHKASNNVIAMNYIGTDVTGAIDLGNAQNGIQLTSKSTGNLIGGEATDGNDPTGDVFARPPQGNLISGNNANGVLIQKQSTGNQLSGNFIGTVASGNAALGNSLDGVFIHKSDNNTLLGCTFQQDPFVFYNVISGNLGNGLRVNNSDDTTIQANFFGMGADNDTAVGNALNGVVVEGNSTRTVMGGPIPLGNVVAANLQNGIVVQDKASFFTTYNTFCGLAAFKDDPIYGNGLDGMLITSTGAGILIRTNVITRNGDDGIEVSGKAKGVRISGNIIGLNTNGFVPMGNEDNGIEIGGSARSIIVGAPQPTFNVIPENTISGNHGHGVAIVGSARDNLVNHSYIGTDVTGVGDRGNHGSGVYLGAGTSGNAIGAVDPTLETVISGNDLHGIEINGSYNNKVFNSYIGVEADGTTALGNGAAGINISGGGYNNTIGSTLANAANIIANNTTNGVTVASGYNNGILGNSIYGNALTGIDLAPGANNNQAAPSLLFAQSVSLGLEITGQLTSTANKTFTLQFFASDDDDWSGQFYLGSLSVTTDASGFVEFTYLSPTPPIGADYFTATATDAKNNTSEFSNVISE